LDEPEARRGSAREASDEERAYQRRFLRGIAWLQILGSASTIATLAHGSGPSVDRSAKLIMLGLSGAVAVLALLQAARGRLAVAGFAMPLCLLIYCATSAWSGYGLHDLAFLGIPLAISAAGLLLGTRGLLVFGAAGLGLAGALWWAEASGRITTPWSPSIGLASLLNAGVLISLNVATLTLLLRGLDESRSRHRGQSAALRASEARWRSLVQDAPITILEASQDGTIEFVNLDAAPASRLVGKNVYELFAGAHRETAQAVVGKALESGAMGSFEAEMGTGEGDRWWYSVHVGPVRVDEEIRGATLLCIDVSERRRARLEREAAIAELEQRNAELGRFTYTVSHDLRSPLITIRGFLGYIESAATAGDFDTVRADLARIASATSKMDRLLGELLELSRIGRLVNAPEDVPAGELVREALALVAGRIAQRGVRVEVADGLPILRGDRPRLVEVFQNLIDNAAKFMGDAKEPRIEIGARRDGDASVLFVRDNGIGIEPRFHDKVFGLFERLDPAVEGTGVGLALVKRVVEVHGGRIWVESPGAGACFCFTLGELSEPRGPAARRAE
jgi:PAS domain S-box-containing protein